MRHGWERVTIVVADNGYIAELKGVPSHWSDTSGAFGTEDNDELLVFTERDDLRDFFHRILGLAEATPSTRSQ